MHEKLFPKIQNKTSVDRHIILLVNRSKKSKFHSIDSTLVDRIKYRLIELRQNDLTLEELIRFFYPNE